MYWSFPQFELNFQFEKKIDNQKSVEKVFDSTVVMKIKGSNTYLLETK